LLPILNHNIILINGRLSFYLVLREVERREKDMFKVVISLTLPTMEQKYDVDSIRSKLLYTEESKKKRSYLHKISIIFHFIDGI
jgi:hypothetical protein